MKGGWPAQPSSLTAAATAGPARLPQPSHISGRGTAKNRKYLQLCYISTSEGPDNIPMAEQGRKCTKLSITPTFALPASTLATHRAMLCTGRVSLAPPQAQGSWDVHGPVGTQDCHQPFLHSYPLVQDILCRLSAAETHFTLKQCLCLNLSSGKVQKENGTRI